MTANIGRSACCLLVLAALWLLVLRGDAGLLLVLIPVSLLLAFAIGCPGRRQNPPNTHAQKGVA